MYTATTPTPIAGPVIYNPEVQAAYRPITDLYSILEETLAKKGFVGDKRNNLPVIDTILSEDLLHQFHPLEVFAYASGFNPKEENFLIKGCAWTSTHKERTYQANGVIFLESQVKPFLNKAIVSHGLCTECSKIAYPKIFQ